MKGFEIFVGFDKGNCLVLLMKFDLFVNMRGQKRLTETLMVQVDTENLFCFALIVDSDWIGVHCDFAANKIYFNQFLQNFHAWNHDLCLLLMKS